VGETLAIGIEAPAIDRHFTTRHPSRTPVSAPAFGEAGLGWRFKQRADHRRPAVAAHTQDEECHLRHQDSPQSFAASAASPSNACGVGGTLNDTDGKHARVIAIPHEGRSRGAAFRDFRPGCALSRGGCFYSGQKSLPNSIRTAFTSRVNRSRSASTTTSLPGTRSSGLA
jgi:hypothetical protein